METLVKKDVFNKTFLVWWRGKANTWDPNDCTVKVDNYLKSLYFSVSNGKYYNSRSWFWIFECTPMIWDPNDRSVNVDAYLTIPTIFKQQDLIPPSRIYIHTCTLYTCTNTFMPRFSPSRFFGPPSCLVPTLGLKSEYPMCSVCACVRTNTHTPTYTPTHIKKYKRHRQHPYLSGSFCQK